MSDSDDLPLGWRPGQYTDQDLIALGVSEVVFTGWIDSRRQDYPGLSALLPELAKGMPAMRVEGYSLIPGSLFGGGLREPYRAMIVVSMPEALSPDGTRSDVPLQHAGFDEYKVLFARLWHRDALFPCLTLRAANRASPSIALEGLEMLARLGDAERLIKHVRFLERLAAAGRPPDDLSEGSAKRAKLHEAEALKRKYPRMTWPQIAGRLGVGMSTLHRWRAKAKVPGISGNF